MRPKGTPHPDMLRGIFYHHLKLGIRIHFERAHNLQHPFKYAVTVNSKVIMYTEDNTEDQAEQVFAQLQQMLTGVVQ